MTTRGHSARESMVAAMFAVLTYALLSIGYRMFMSATALGAGATSGQAARFALVALAAFALTTLLHVVRAHQYVARALLALMIGAVALVFGYFGNPDLFAASARVPELAAIYVSALIPPLVFAYRAGKSPATR